MSHSSHAHSARIDLDLPNGRRHHLLHVESLEQRRMLSVNDLSHESFELLNEYFRAVYALDPTPVRSLDSLLSGDVDPIVECPGLREVFCLPDTKSLDSTDAAMGADAGLDDDWFTIDSSKRALLEANILLR